MDVFLVFGYMFNWFIGGGLAGGCVLDGFGFFICRELTFQSVDCLYCSGSVRPSAAFYMSINHNIEPAKKSRPFKCSSQAAC